MLVSKNNGISVHNTKETKEAFSQKKDHVKTNKNLYFSTQNK
jgi:hypothetical protein